MIGGIDSQADIELFLDEGELEMLSREVIEGTLIKTNAPKRQGRIRISVNDERKHEDGPFGIGINSKGYWGVREDFVVEVFMGSEWYRKLLEGGVVGTRQGMRDGSKIHVYDSSRMEDFMDLGRLEDLEFYRDNKDRLRDELG